MIPHSPGADAAQSSLSARHRLTGSGGAEGTNALAEADGGALRLVGSRRVCLRGGWTRAGAERALSAERSSRHQRNALTGEPDRAIGCGRAIAVRSTRSWREVESNSRSRANRRCFSGFRARRTPQVQPLRLTHVKGNREMLVSVPAIFEAALVHRSSPDRARSRRAPRISMAPIP